MENRAGNLGAIAGGVPPVHRIRLSPGLLENPSVKEFHEQGGPFPFNLRPFFIAFKPGIRMDMKIQFVLVPPVSAETVLDQEVPVIK